MQTKYSDVNIRADLVGKFLALKNCEASIEIPEIWYLRLLIQFLLVGQFWH